MKITSALVAVTSATLLLSEVAAVPSLGPGPAGCTGASVSLATDQCAAWGKFWDGAGGPNWAGKGQNCSKSDPCACRYGVECSGGSITTILLSFSNLRGTISNAVGAFVDMESFNVAGSSLTGSLPASMSAWKKVKFFSVRGCSFNTALPVLNYRAMKHCDLCAVGEAQQPCGTGFSKNIFSCPFPPEVTDRCSKYDGGMSYDPITDADCHNTTAFE